MPQDFWFVVKSVVMNFKQDQWCKLHTTQESPQTQCSHLVLETKGVEVLIMRIAHLEGGKSRTVAGVGSIFKSQGVVVPLKSHPWMTYS